MGTVGEIFPLPVESYISLAPLIVPLAAAYLAQRWSARSPQRQQTSWAPPYSPKPSPNCSSWSLWPRPSGLPFRTEKQGQRVT